MKYVNTCTYPIDLNDGRTLEMGGVVELDIADDNMHDQAYVTRGVLAVVAEPEPEPDNEDTPPPAPHGGRKGGKA